MKNMFGSKFDMAKCPDCEIKELKEDLKKGESFYGRESIREKKEALKELEKLTGKGNNDNPPRERERDDFVLFHQAQHQIHYFTGQKPSN
ncbi:MAG: hypothetical protein NY202_02920 [Mollicutes bacterium UO1]